MMERHVMMAPCECIDLDDIEAPAAWPPGFGGRLCDPPAVVHVTRVHAVDAETNTADLDERGDEVWDDAA